LAFIGDLFWNARRFVSAIDTSMLYSLAVLNNSNVLFYQFVHPEVALEYLSRI
jgi:hypothetical protein